MKEQEPSLTPPTEELPDWLQPLDRALLDDARLERAVIDQQPGDAPLLLGEALAGEQRAETRQVPFAQVQQQQRHVSVPERGVSIRHC